MGDQKLPGLTGTVIIETSHLAVHTFTAHNYIAIDIFSCRNFDEQKVINTLKAVFNIKHMNIKVFIRCQPEKITEKFIK